MLDRHRYFVLDYEGRVSLEREVGRVASNDFDSRRIRFLWDDMCTVNMIQEEVDK